MRVTWHLGAVFTLTIFILMVPLFVGVTYLKTEIGLTSIAAGVAFSIFALTRMVGGYTWGIISDFLPRKYVIATGSILFAILLLALVSFGKETATIYVIIAGMGFALGIYPVTFAMASSYFPLQIIGTASGLLNAFGGVGFMV